jgi:hypothetical protein
LFLCNEARLVFGFNPQQLHVVERSQPAATAGTCSKFKTELHFYSTPLQDMQRKNTGRLMRAMQSSSGKLEGASQSVAQQDGTKQEQQAAAPKL